MEHLGAADLMGVLNAVRRIEAAPTLDGYRTAAVASLGELIPSDSFGYNEIDHASGQVFFLPTPAEIGPLLAEPWMLYMDQHPVLSYAVTTGDGSAHQISDFLGPRAFHALDLYDTCHRPFGFENELAIGPLMGPPFTIGIAMNRGPSGFSERDRAVADLMVPHLRAGFENARARELATAVGEWEDASAGVLLLNAAGSVLVASAAAERLIRAYFPREGRDPVPETLRAWVSAQGQRLNGDSVAPAPNHPLVVEGTGGRLVVRLLPAASAGSPQRILMEERRSPVDFDALRTHGLTARQVEVLGLAARGYIDKQIAAELSISVRTVRKHFENVYERLGAHGRAAAIARAAELRDQPTDVG